ncbi:MAG: DUF2141 domain-containing protein [Leptospiraceae bacterium]|nr:DUF2141 domain-containing protein [Leptospiraceae bacterium]
MIKYFSLFILLMILKPTLLLALDIEVLISNRKSETSTIYCGIYNNAKGFPTESNLKLKGTTASMNKEGKLSCKFKELSKGIYSISLLEDLNGNGIMDSTLVGFPKEPWGVSNNAPMHTFGPPTFEEASFPLNENKIIAVRLNK